MSERDVTVAIVEDELTAVRAYVDRQGWTVKWDSDNLRLVFDGQQTKSNEKVRIVANLDGYRAVAPAWTFEDPDGSEGNPFPEPGNLRGGKGSVFHNSGRICAPFNRLAYKELGGPHGNWGGATNWLEVNQNGHVRAHYLARMIAIIVGHLEASPRMKS